LACNPRQQTIERGEAGAAEEDAIEAGAQCEGSALAWAQLVNLEIGVEIQIRREPAVARRDAGP